MTSSLINSFTAPYFAKGYGTLSQDKSYDEFAISTGADYIDVDC